MHYFIDHQQLPTQDAADTFGPDSVYPSILWNATSMFQLATPAKAFACEDGMMVVQQSEVDESLVNVIIEPRVESALPIGKVKYYIYRGISKNSLVNGLNLVDKSDTNNELIKRIYNARSETTYTASILGYDNNMLGGTVQISTIFLKGVNDIKPIQVNEGEWFGDFTNTHKIGFEIILETDKIDVNLNFVRKAKTVITTTGLVDFDLRLKREEILSFIDPAAFWGLNYLNGVKFSTYTGITKVTYKKIENELYLSFILPFFSRTRIYLDVRSEYGYSYNFYQNYADGNEKNIKLGNNSITPIEKVYETSGWPIIFTEDAATISDKKNDIKFSLRIDDNLKPLIFYEDLSVFDSSDKSFFIDEKILLLSDIDIEWTRVIAINIPNTGTMPSKANVAYYLKLYYFRQEFNPNSPSTVLKKELDIDNFFSPLDIPNLFDDNNIFQHSEHTQPVFKKGEHPAEPTNPNPPPGDIDEILSKSNTFSQISGTGAYFDSNLVTFYSKLKIPKKRSSYSLLASPIKNLGLNLNGAFNKQSFLAKGLSISSIEIQEVIGTDVFEKINLLNVFANNSETNKKEDVALLGLTKAETARLRNVTGLSTKHPWQIVFDPQYPSPIDKNGIPYKKYLLKVLGLDNNGHSAKVSPVPAVEVYSEENWIVSASKGFADLVVTNFKKGIEYAIEEPIDENDITYENLNLGTDSYEDFTLIGYSQTRDKDKNPDMQYGKFGDIKSIRTDIQAIRDDIEALFSEMTRLFAATTALNPQLNWVAKSFIYLFSINDSDKTIYEHPTLNKEVAKRSSYINYVKAFGKDLENRLRLVQGNISDVDTIVYPDNDNQLRPSFPTSYDKLHGLKILINDTESTKIYIEPGSYEFDQVTGKWSIKLIIKILDNFGLDPSDLRYQYVEFGDGFAAWYVLQHFHGFIPFRTRVVTRCQISGNLYS